ncbi:MAG: hypothetical protein COB51_14075 [Moraxellaceae bacterium]|nr:MAG: hypothetical protein COB51_14075 [Moraxellaceae bacterium]
MAVFVDSFARPLKGALEGERVYEVVLFPHDDSSAGFFLFLDVEVAVIKTEVFAVLAVQTTKILKT